MTDALPNQETSEILETLARIERSAEFRDAPQQTAFLRFAVEQSLKGNRAILSGYGIATSVFQRSEDFDPQIDPIVRVEATKLRRKLQVYYATDGQSEAWKISMPKGGYSVVFDKRHSSVSTEPNEPKTHEGGVEKSSKPHRSSMRLGLVALITAALTLVVVGVVGVAMFWQWQSALLEPAAPLRFPDIDPRQEAVNIPMGPSVAVLPLRTENAEAKIVASTMRAAIIDDLTKYHHLRTLAPSVGDSLVDSPQATATAAMSYGIDYLIDSFVSIDQSDFQATAILINARTNEVLWSEGFARPLLAGEPDGLAQEIADQIVAKIASSNGIINLTERKALGSRLPPKTFDAYQCVLFAGNYYQNVSEERHAESRDCLERVIESNPDYATAWATLTYLYLDEVRKNYNPRPDSVVRAREVANKSVSLEPTNAYGFRALSAVDFHEGKLDDFRRNAEKALELNPNDAEALADLGAKLAYAGDWDRGIAMQNKSIVLNPVFPAWQYWLFVYDAYRRQDYQEALRVLNQIDMPDYFVKPMLMAASLGMLDRLEDGKKQVERLLVLQPDAASLSREHFNALNFDDALIEEFMQGLAKAGL